MFCSLKSLNQLPSEGEEMGFIYWSPKASVAGPAYNYK
jgi:hypothetical protein